MSEPGERFAAAHVSAVLLLIRTRLKMVSTKRTGIIRPNRVIWVSSQVLTAG